MAAGADAREGFAASQAIFARVVGWLDGEAAAGLTHAELEARLDAAGRELLCQLFQDHLDLRAERGHPPPPGVGPPPGAPPGGVGGARARARSADERATAPRLFAFMCGVWPQLKGYRITHAWKGNVAMTFDHLPHMGVQDGVHYALGCNGSGVAMMTYLGHQTALKILGRQNRPCAFDGVAFPTRPFYTGTPWFLPIVGSWYRLRDALERATEAYRG
jgi:hypothetical protein